MVTDGEIPLTRRSSQTLQLGLGLGLEFPNRGQRRRLRRGICTWVPLLTGRLWCNELLIRSAGCLTHCTVGQRLEGTSPSTGADKSPGTLPSMPWVSSLSRHAPGHPSSQHALSGPSSDLAAFCLGL